MTPCMCVPNFWRNTLPPLSEQHSCRCHMDWPLGVKCLIKTHLYLHDLMHSCHQKYSIRTAGMYSTPYRLDLAPSDYHLFGYLKDNMRGQQRKKLIQSRNLHISGCNVMNWISTGGGSYSPSSSGKKHRLFPRICVIWHVQSLVMVPVFFHAHFL